MRTTTKVAAALSAAMKAGDNKQKRSKVAAHVKGHGISPLHLSFRRNVRNYSPEQAMRAALRLMAEEELITDKPAAQGAEKKPDDNPDRLKVLVDSDAARLVQKLYNQYVSENDFADLVIFIKDFDSLLAKYRKDKPLTKEEIARIEREQGGDDMPTPKKKKKGPPVADGEIENSMPKPQDGMDEEDVKPDVEGYDPSDEEENEFDMEDDGEDAPSVVISSHQREIGRSLARHIKRK